MSKGKLFLISFGTTTLLVCLLIFLGGSRRPRFRPPKLIPIAENIYLTSQLETSNIPALRMRAIRTIVDIRPDGEDQNQAPSSAIEAAARENNLRFHYIPVPHNGIPDSAVTALDHALSGDAGRTVLYCRTGRRAVRLYALVLASRPNGPSTETILKMVSDASFSADDLKEEITQRISHRNTAEAANP